MASTHPAFPALCARVAARTGSDGHNPNEIVREIMLVLAELVHADTAKDVDDVVKRARLTQVRHHGAEAITAPMLHVQPPQHYDCNT